ncbi:hypothetical protein [Azospirillum sp. TSO22-1]|uniref:hypothetical protein n=1 Tax=Azospirillum sp. TSO22-1 TaxID=716789 RepID=UPI000D60CE8E|nr:hypothetical protein [Azospirillum sp. TSO22-1]PWC45690.1 hypothetical protein TSO221_16075 [Azospirillum sp. TSO22-1]
MAQAAGRGVLTRLAALRDAPEPLAALLVDFRGIEHGDDPRFSLTLDHYLESWLGAREREVFRLPGPRLLILAPADAAPLLESGAQALVQVLRQHGFGAMRFTTWDVARDAARLAAEVAPPEALDRARALAAAERVPTAALGQVLEVERVLHGADIESLVREQTVWSFADPDQPEPVLTELAVSMEELEARLDLPLRRDAWLRHEVFARLDRGLMRHVARDRLHDRRPLAIDLHTATVLDDRFSELAHAIPAEMRRRLTAELACWESGLSSERFVAAATRLADLGFAVAVDHVPLTALGALDLGGVEVAAVKALWVPGTPDAEALLRAGVGRFGPERLVLWRCERPDAVETGRRAGVALFQGHAADAAARGGGAEASEPPPRSRGRAEPEAATEDEAPEAGKPRGGLLARLFGRGG